MANQFKEILHDDGKSLEYLKYEREIEERKTDPNFILR
jgi:hypothetical protein